MAWLAGAATPAAGADPCPGDQRAGLGNVAHAAVRHLVRLPVGRVHVPPAAALRRHHRRGARGVPGSQPVQSSATSRAAQISRFRGSASRPRRLTRTATETLSRESRLTAQRWGTGSLSGSRTTSLASPRIVVVHGATSVRRSRGIAALRDMTTTGRPAGLGHLGPPELTAGRKRTQLVPATRRHDAKSPQASGSSGGCSSYAL